MKDISIFHATSIPPLPPELAVALSGAAAGLPKRERTRRQLLEAAIQVFCARGVAPASVQEIAAAAGTATTTLYNHFKTKEEIVQALAVWLAETLCRRISDSHVQVAHGAERMAIGNRRYIWLAEESPAWALLLLDVALAAPGLALAIREYPLADLRLGVKQKSFRVPSEAAAIDLIQGTVAQAMRNVALGLAPANHGVAVATMVLRGLGMPDDEAAAVAKRPLPPFPPPGAAAPAARRARQAA